MWRWRWRGRCRWGGWIAGRGEGEGCGWAGRWQWGWWQRTSDKLPGIAGQYIGPWCRYYGWLPADGVTWVRLGDARAYPTATTSGAYRMATHSGPSPTTTNSGDTSPQWAGDYPGLWFHNNIPWRCGLCEMLRQPESHRMTMWIISSSSTKWMVEAVFPECIHQKAISQMRTRMALWVTSESVVVLESKWRVVLFRLLLVSSVVRFHWSTLFIARIDY